MRTEVVPLNSDLLGLLLEDAPASLLQAQLHRAYFSPGSASCCLLADGAPVFAGGIVNLQWNRGEAWILPTRFFRQHLKICLRALRAYLPCLVSECGFKRVQATCIHGISGRLFVHIGFEYEGTMKKFGPNGETCDMYARVFEETA